MDAEHPRTLPLPERLYHSCHNNPATARDFWSWERIKGKEHPDPKQRQNAQGISTWGTLEHARAEAASSGAQGAWIAEIELPPCPGCTMQADREGQSLHTLSRPASIRGRRACDAPGCGGTTMNDTPYALFDEFGNAWGWYNSIDEALTNIRALVNRGDEADATMMKLLVFTDERSTLLLTGNALVAAATHAPARIA